jgi:hypothetical protein
MTGSGLWQFLIVCVELIFIGGLIFLGIDYVISADANFKRIAKYAVGGALVLYFLFAVGSVFFGQGSQAALAVSPVALLQLGIAIIALFVVVYIVNLFVGWWAPAPAREIILYVVGAVAIIVMMLVAANVLSGGNLGSSFRLKSENAGSHVAARPGVSWAVTRTTT